MGRPKTKRYTLPTRIDIKLDEFIRDFSRREKLNYREASEEIAKWLKKTELKEKKEIF